MGHVILVESERLTYSSHAILELFLGRFLGQIGWFVAFATRVDRIFLDLFLFE